MKRLCVLCKLPNLSFLVSSASSFKCLIDCRFVSQSFTVFALIPWHTVASLAVAVLLLLDWRPAAWLERKCFISSASFALMAAFCVYSSSGEKSPSFLERHTSCWAASLLPGQLLVQVSVCVRVCVCKLEPDKWCWIKQHWFLLTFIHDRAIKACKRSEGEHIMRVWTLKVS